MVLFTYALSLFYCDKKHNMKSLLLANVYVCYTVVLVTCTLLPGSSLGLFRLAGLKL